MPRRIREFLLHILDEADYIEVTVVGLSKEQFLADATLKRAIVRSIEIIGEAARQLPDDWRAAHPRMDWKSMAGMRDRLIHGYFGVDYEIVWDVATLHIPRLKVEITAILANEIADE